MPTYEYLCSNKKCNHSFEIIQRMIEDALLNCPECHRATLQRQIGLPFVFIKGEPKTVGHQASRNTENMGHYEYEDRVYQNKKRVRKASDKLVEQTGGKNITTSSELPWYRSGKVEGLPKIDKPISMIEAQKLAKETGIKIRPPKPRKK